MEFLPPESKAARLDGRAFLDRRIKDSVLGQRTKQVVANLFPVYAQQGRETFANLLVKENADFGLAIPELNEVLSLLGKYGLRLGMTEKEIELYRAFGREPRERSALEPVEREPKFWTPEHGREMLRRSLPPATVKRLAQAEVFDDDDLHGLDRWWLESRGMTTADIRHIEKAFATWKVPFYACFREEKLTIRETISD